jgi:hypothetical protein
VGIVELFRVLWRQDIWVSHAAKVRFEDG